MGKSKCCNDGYQNLANVVSKYNFPSVTNTEESATLSSTDSIDWTISDDTKTLICQNSGVWNISAVYKLKNLNTGLGKVDGIFNINGNDFKNTKNSATILTPTDSVYIPNNSTQLVLLTVGLSHKFNTGDKLQLNAKSTNETIGNTGDTTVYSDILNIQVSGMHITMTRR
jgi:hypothetical protein